jgi:PAT family beta-lactamase induction signal transducer AmpG
MAPDQSSPVYPARWVPTLYFAEGLPFVAIAMVSALMYKNMGIADAQITFWTSLVMLPWTLKPLWGPLLEMFKTKKYFVVATEFVGGVAFGFLALSLPLSGFFRYSIALFVGWQGAAYNIAKVFTQGALVYLAGQLERSVGITRAWMTIMGVYGAVLVTLSIYHARFLPSGGAATQVTTLREGFRTLWDVIRTFFQKKYILWGILFIVLYRFAEGQAIKIVPLFFKAARDHGGLGLTTSEIGIVYGTFGAAAFVIGSLLAGYFIAGRGLRKSLFILCCFFNIPFAVYAFLSITMPTDLAVIATAVVFEYFGYGFGFTGLTLFMMQQIAPGKYKMAHYAFATGIMNLGMMIPSMLSGLISDWLGYRSFFIWVMFATIPSFIMTWLVPFRETESETPPP